MATDIAFAVGILTLLGKRVPAALRVLLLALAIIDDLGAIVVIALFYSSGIALSGLLVAALGFAGVFAMQRLGVRTKLASVVPSIVAWAAVGNVVGSNIFNTFVCLGAAGSMGAPLHTLGADLVALVVMTGLAAAVIRTERRISRLEGGVAVALYAMFTAITVVRG
jgi:Na+/H+ antiporter NhaA